MAKPRTRYILRRTRVNDVDLTGQEVVELGYCNWTGDLCRKKRAPERERDHLLVRLEDVKFVRANKLPFRLLTIPVNMKNAFLVDPEEYRNSLTI